MRWAFDKYSGCGNDFILFDNRKENFPEQKNLIQTLCHRRLGIGADGILLWENSQHADAKMRIFNSDGSEAEMCGNGLRCFYKWLGDKSSDYSSRFIEVNGRVLKASQTKEGISIDMGIPSHQQWNIPITFENEELFAHHLDTGVPHTVVFVNDIQTVDLQGIGSYIRWLWKPNGTNVTFAQKMGPQMLKVRTYERGVEGETPACGTGAVAAAFSAAYLFNWLSPIVIETSSKEFLSIDFLIEAQNIRHVALTGPALYLFHGEIDLDVRGLNSQHCFTKQLNKND